MEDTQALKKMIPEILEKYSLDLHNRTIERLKASTRAVIYPSLVNFEEPSPQDYTIDRVSTKVSSIICRIRSNAQFLYIKKVKLERSNFCLTCSSLLTDDWFHILGGCFKTLALRHKHDVNLREILRNSNNENCKKLYKYLIELSTEYLCTVSLTY